MKLFHVTYDIVTPESAEHGDIADHGFVGPDDRLYSMSDSPVGPAFVPIMAEHALTLREAVELIGCIESDGNGLTYYETDGRANYRTGDETRYAFHLPFTATAASMARVARLLKKERLL